MTFNIPYFLLLFSVNVWAVNSTSQTFYKALYSESLETIDAALEHLDDESSNSTNKAYKGALLMKKSGFMKSAAKKIEVFKDGHKMLEAAIKKYPENTEYRFIRLTIQEHAPKILKYNKNLEEDKALVVKGYGNMASKTRSYVLDYAQQSEILKVKDLK